MIENCEHRVPGFDYRGAPCVACLERRFATAERERDEAREKLAVAVEALDGIAAWYDGPVVRGGFDEPGSAQTAREVLARIRGDKR